jgi:hypothetical protein
LLKSNLECVLVFDQCSVSCISDSVVYVLSDDWDYLFLSVAFYVGGGEYDFVRVIYLVSFNIKQAVKLKDLGFKLGAFSIEEVRLLNLDCVSSVGVA